MITFIFAFYLVVAATCGNVTIWVYINAHRNNKAILKSFDDEINYRLPEPEPNIPSAIEEWDAHWEDYQKRMS